MAHAKFTIVKSTLISLVIEDVGPWHVHPTVTNDAEHVVELLALRQRRLLPTQRLYYYDSDGELGELLVRDGRFAGFAPVRSEDDVR
jgi:hypothetical protein